MAWILRRGVDSFLPNLAQQEAPHTLLGLHEPQEAEATLFGLHEPLDKEGYLHVRDYGDEASMESFLRRLLQSQKHELTEIIPCLAVMCCKEKKDFEEVLSIVGHDMSAGYTSTLGFSQTSMNSLSQDTTGVEVPHPPVHDCEDAATMPLPASQAPLPFEPSNGSAFGGFRIKWRANPVPVGIWIGGRPCAPLREDSFVAPCSDISGSVDVVAVFKDQEAVNFTRAFSYWEPGILHSITPSYGAQDGEIKVKTSHLGGEITEISLGGQKCRLLGRPTATDACFVVPPDLEGSVKLQLAATNGNEITMEAAFTVIESVLFGHVGSCLGILDGSSSVHRTTGVNHGVCISSKPLRLQNMERRFRIRVDEMGSKGGLRALAVGFAVLSSLDVMPSGQVRAKEATDLSRAWLVGYDRGGALLCSPGSLQKLPAGAWRPAKDLEVGSMLEILFRQNQIIVYQDNQERACCFVNAEEGPGQNEELHAVVDLQGAVTRISLVNFEPS